VAMQCPGSLDPNQACPSPSEPAVPVTQKPVLPKLAAAKRAESTLKGRCELVIEGRKGVLPCTGLTLTLKSTLDDETRPVYVDGYSIRAEELNGESYRLKASSEKYEVSTDSGVLQPGQTVKIRIRGKSLRR
jgi:hypothetical protein